MVMKRSGVIISHKARASLRKHIEHLKKKASTETAETVRKGIIARCKELKDFSGYSVERYLEGTEKKYRSVTQWNYNIIYTVEKEQVRVLNIIHTSRHPSKRKDL
ncbi:MAG: type II toxin-antitoxin system RelE/ParE family toxin [Bacteroidota bacterium]